MDKVLEKFDCYVVSLITDEHHKGRNYLLAHRAFQLNEKYWEIVIPLEVKIYVLKPVARRATGILLSYFHSRDEELSEFIAQFCDKIFKEVKRARLVERRWSVWSLEFAIKSIMKINNGMLLIFPINRNWSFSIEERRKNTNIILQELSKKEYIIAENLISMRRIPEKVATEVATRGMKWQPNNVSITSY